MFKNRFSKLFLAAVVIVAALATISFAAKSSTQAIDRAYDAVEQVRAQRLAGSGLVTDNSYDLIEGIRLSRTIGAATDHGYDQIEGLRLARSANASTADRSYDLIENVRTRRTN